MPARVVLQDFTGVPAVVDLAAMRDAMADLGGDPAKVNPLVPADLVIDHSVQVDAWGGAGAFAINVEREYERNGERYQLLRWAQTAFRDLRVVPPGTGIIHQVNLEYLATVVTDREDAGGRVAYPDTLVGTDSHTTMVNGLGVLGYGVGGIEAEAVLLGQPLYQPMPRIVGVRLTGELPTASTATDLVLVITELLRGFGVVGAFVEFAGDGLAGLSLADRATISNMSPEFGATAHAVPDRRRDAHLPAADRPAGRARRPRRALREGPGPVARARQRARVRRRARARPRDGRAVARRAAASAGPRRAGGAGGELPRGLPADGRRRSATPSPAREDAPPFGHGSVAIAAITSCTNTSNPTVMVGAGLLARNAVARGPARLPHRQDLARPGLQGRDRVPREGRPHGAARRRSASRWRGTGARRASATPGPSPSRSPPRSSPTSSSVAAVLSGNRNFEGRIHPLVRASYLASPPLVVAFALAGRVDVDLTTEPLGTGSDGRPVMLADIWPTPAEIRTVIARLDRPGAVPAHVRLGVRGRRPVEGAADPVGRPLRVGRGVDVHRPPAVLRGAHAPSPRRSATSRARGCSRCSATRSRPTTSAPRARSPRGRRPGPGSRRTASGRSSSTRTGPAAGTTR